MEWLRRFNLCGCQRPRTARSGNQTPAFAVAREDLGWILEVTYRTLTAWMVEPETCGVLEWVWPHSPECCSGQHYLTFAAPEWDVCRETKAEASDRILAALKGQVTRYLEEREQRARQEGMAQRPRTWTPHHFEWLVRFQVQGWSHNQIATAHDCTRQTIPPALNQVANLMVGPKWKQWLRPPGKPGRPRSS
jgi:hypothetical protein